jgi:hypothetical protein
MWEGPLVGSQPCGILDNLKSAAFADGYLKWKETMMFVSENVMGNPDLAQLTQAINLQAAGFGPANDGKKDHRQDADDKYNQEQLQQGHARAVAH